MTLHALQRAIERAGLSEKAAICMMDLAQQHGRRAEDYGYGKRKYLKAKCKRGCQAVIYCGYCFIFSEAGVVITMYPASSFGNERKTQGRSSCCDGKTLIRNPKKYFTRYAVPDPFYQ